MRFLLTFCLRLALNAAIVWAMATYLATYVMITHSLQAYVTIGAIITVLNIVVRPLLSLLTLPLKMIATIVAIIVVNGVFIELTVRIVRECTPWLTFAVQGGLLGWVIAATALGFGNWIIRHILR